jgi:hypothetical protein
VREHRSDELAKMQLEIERVMKNVSRDFDMADGDGKDHPPSGSGPGLGLSSEAGITEEAVFVKREKRATGCGQALATTTCFSDLLVAVVLAVALLFG